MSHTFSSHPHLQTFLEPAVLTLIPVMLVDGAGAVASAGVGQVPPHGSLEETFTTFAGKLSVMFARTFIRTHYTFNL